MQSLMSDQQDDTEISLGTGKLLLVFFGLAVLCGGFFGVGYMIGKNSAAPQQTLADSTTQAPMPGAKPSSALGNNGASPKPQDCAAPGTCEQQPAAGTTPFYDSVGDKNVTPKLEPATAPPQPAPSEKPAGASPEAAKPSSASSAPGSGFIVQVAAVSKQQDADSLVSALRKKQYPVFVTRNPALDKLFHVQAGPFSEFKEAESIKARLINDGYSPILKR